MTTSNAVNDENFVKILSASVTDSLFVKYDILEGNMMTSSNGKVSALLAICVGIHRSPMTSPHKGQSRGALMCSLICAWINGWGNNGETGDSRRHRAHYDVTVMICDGTESALYKVPIEYEYHVFQRQQTMFT